jgi:hypothetical protein
MPSPKSLALAVAIAFTQPCAAIAATSDDNHLEATPSPFTKTTTDGMKCASLYLGAEHIEHTLGLAWEQTQGRIFEERGTKFFANRDSGQYAIAIKLNEGLCVLDSNVTELKPGQQASPVFGQNLGL